MPTEKMAENILSGQKCAKSVHRKHVQSRAIKPKFLIDRELQLVGENGGGGIRKGTLKL